LDGLSFLDPIPRKHDKLVWSMDTVEDAETPPRAPNCLQCRYFHVSWDPRFPRSCSVFGIKSKKLPSHAVHEATGRHCPAFQKSPKIKT
jgi:hypothetical protein